MNNKYWISSKSSIKFWNSELCWLKIKHALIVLLLLFICQIYLFLLLAAFNLHHFCFQLFLFFFSLRHTQNKYVGVHFPKSFKWKKIQRFCFQMENFCSIRYINIWADAMCICKCYRTLFFASLFAQSSFVTCLSMLHLNVACTMNAFLWIKFALGRLLVVCLENISISEKIP